MTGLFCGCDHWGMCLYHASLKSVRLRGVDGLFYRVDQQAEYAERCRAVDIMAQFCKVLAVIGWAAHHCPSCRVYWGPGEAPQHDGWGARIGQLRDPLYEPERRCWYDRTWAFRVGAVWL